MYIQAAAGISPQRSFEAILTQPQNYNGNRLSCQEPDYAQLIDPRMIRRMSRIIKMGVAAAKECLREAGWEVPDAIITGTAYGCLADTELFLAKMIENKEELLTPTAFIQSTHNTVGAQIALLLKCHNYNNTFVHRGFSFESALLDAITLIKEEEISTALVGGVDEITPVSHAILSRFGLYRKEHTDSAALLNTPGKGTMAGEGALFFALSASPSGNDCAKLDDIYTFYKPADRGAVKEQILSFLQRNRLAVKDIDLVITGENGDVAGDAVYTALKTGVWGNAPAISFKQLCGEYPTATGFALWLAVHILHTGKVPGLSPATKPRRVLIYNHYQHIHHSIYLLTAC
ncbi:MAG: beta-ketoacyl synthase chain length factor [Chitinophagaceae bacterium]|nr:beta-ketoacyl synthase chain length factor [Chitinophagaceae bacterium]